MKHLEISRRTPALISVFLVSSPHFVGPVRLHRAQTLPPTPTIVLVTHRGNYEWFSWPNAGRKEAERDSSNFSSANTT